MESDHIEYTLDILLWQSAQVSQLALHLVSAEVSRGDLTVGVEYFTLALPAIIGPLSLVNRMI